MSQAKVDQYKKEKANRKEIIAKQKRNRLIGKICGTVVGCVLAVWIGISTVEFIIENRPVETIYCQTDAIDTYISSLYADDATEADK